MRYKEEEYYLKHINDCKKKVARGKKEDGVRNTREEGGLRKMMRADKT